jgi:hypothetical protein
MNLVGQKSQAQIYLYTNFTNFSICKIGEQKSPHNIIHTRNLAFSGDLWTVVSEEFSSVNCRNQKTGTIHIVMSPFYFKLFMRHLHHSSYVYPVVSYMSGLSSDYNTAQKIKLLYYKLVILNHTLDDKTISEIKPSQIYAELTPHDDYSIDPSATISRRNKPSNNRPRY